MIGIADFDYSNKKVYFKFKNLSAISGDKWARDICARISGTHSEQIIKNLVGPGKEYPFYFEEEYTTQELENKKILLSYKSSSEKIYNQEYIILKHKDNLDIKRIK